VNQESRHCSAQLLMNAQTGQLRDGGLTTDPCHYTGGSSNRTERTEARRIICLPERNPAHAFKNNALPVTGEEKLP
jgi:hypothetical protein